MTRSPAGLRACSRLLQSLLGDAGQSNLSEPKSKSSICSSNRNPRAFTSGASGKRVVSPYAGLSYFCQRGCESPPSLGVCPNQKHRWPRRNALVSVRRRNNACNRPLCNRSVSCWRISPIPLRGSVINMLIDLRDCWAVPNGACENGQAVLESTW